jgi:hypothetical protein
MLILSGSIMKPKYDASEMQLRVEAPAKDLKSLLITLPDHYAITDIFDYILGALYGLSRAIEIGFIDRPAGWHNTYRPHLPQYVGCILEKKKLNDKWLAGFYFNSAIQRIAACFDRIPKSLGATGPNARARMAKVSEQTMVAWDKVYTEVNALKHDVTGRAQGRTVGIEDAVNAFTEVVGFLKTNANKLRNL